MLPGPPWLLTYHNLDIINSVWTQRFMFHIAWYTTNMLNTTHEIHRCSRFWYTEMPSAPKSAFHQNANCAFNPTLLSTSSSFWSKTVVCLSFCERLTWRKASGKILGNISSATALVTQRILSNQWSLQEMVWFAFYLTMDVVSCSTVSDNAKPSLEFLVF